MEPSEILKNSKTILLVDWPDMALPITLLNAGFEVYTYCPDQYAKAEMKDGQLVFDDLTGNPVGVDIANIFRPEAEHQRIIEKIVSPLGAKTVWLHPPVTSKFKNKLATKYGVELVEGVNIADVVAGLK